MTGFESKSRQRSFRRESRFGVLSSTSISRYLPIRTELTSGIPRCCIASRTAAPCGSSTAAFGVTSTLTFMLQYSESERRRQVESSRSLAHHLRRFLVLAHSEKNRLPQFHIPRPLRQSHLANEDQIPPFS